MEKSLETMGRILESVSRTNEGLVDGIISTLHTIETNLRIDGEDRERKLQDYRSGIIEKTHKAAKEQTSEEQEKIDQHIDGRV